MLDRYMTGTRLQHDLQQHLAYRHGHFHKHSLLKALAKLGKT